jgi:hypothetical protein
MTSKAFIKDDWQRDGIKVAVIRESHGRRELLTWTLGEVQVLDEADYGRRVEDDTESYLHIQEDDARALYEALADHFGHAGHDIRALRKDYDAERSRVDKFIAHLTRTV